MIGNNYLGAEGLTPLVEYEWWSRSVNVSRRVLDGRAQKGAAARERDAPEEDGAFRTVIACGWWGGFACAFQRGVIECAAFR